MRRSILIFALLAAACASPAPVTSTFLQPSTCAVELPREHELALLAGQAVVTIGRSDDVGRNQGHPVGLLLFVLCWNEYLFAAFLGSNNALTLPSWMAGQVSIKEAQVGSEAEETAHLAAATVLMAVPLLAAASMIQRFLGRRFAQVR